MPSFADSIFLFILALLLFGPKKLPVLARELGKWMGEFRRASNEFKMQMEDELRASEQADRQKQIAAMEAAAPIPPALDEPAEPEHPHLRHNTVAAEPALLAPEPSLLPPQPAADAIEPPPSYGAEGRHPISLAGQLVDPIESRHPERSEGSPHPAETPTIAQPASSPAPTNDGVRPIPIATSGSLNMMPPATGLPTPRSRGGNGALSSLVESIPEAGAPSSPTAPPSAELGVHGSAPESLVHGD